jgi:lipoprotein
METWEKELPEFPGGSFLYIFAAACPVSESSGQGKNEL